MDVTVGWRDLLAAAPMGRRVPWLGDRILGLGSQLWQLQGPLPREHGWYVFDLDTRRQARWPGGGPVQPEPEDLERLLLRQRGYLLGDRFIPDAVDARTAIRLRAGTMATAFAEAPPPPPALQGPQPRFLDDGTPLPPWAPTGTITDDVGEPVHFLEPGLRRFTRISVGRATGAGRLLFCRQEMGLGPEDDVLGLFEDLPIGLRDPTLIPEATAKLRAIVGVPPALEAAFFFALRERVEMERFRERQRQLEEAALRAEQQAAARAAFLEQTSSSEGRRRLAQVDYAEAAKAALLVGNAEFLSEHSNRGDRGEHVVRFRYMQRRFECVADARLHIVDAGLCLSDHATGRRDDKLLTLESLPSVIAEAIRRGKLVVTRHA